MSDSIAPSLPTARVIKAILAALCLVLIGCFLLQPAIAEDNYAIVIHGGAGGNPDAWSEAYRQQRRDSLAAAIQLGEKLLKEGTPAMDVVEQVVSLMEDDETFNAGRGCVLNESGEHELDASIMDGSTLRCGAVASVTKVKNPITLARQVLLQTRHVLLMGEGADKFGQSIGLEQAEEDYFRTDRQKANWKKWKERQALQSQGAQNVTRNDESYYGTVGCVVLDTHGNLAAATSTGGLMGKRWGRVGDSPLIGSGNYADNATCAVSGTGIGEEFIRHQVASDIAARMRYANASLDKAASSTIGLLPENCGGIIAVDANGNVCMEFNTLAMSRAYATSSGQHGVYLARENEDTPK